MCERKTNRLKSPESHPTLSCQLSGEVRRAARRGTCHGAGDAGEGGEDGGRRNDP